MADNNRGGGRGRGGGGGFRGRGGGGGGGGGHRGGRGGHGHHQEGGERGGERSERPKKENILDLSKYQDKEIRVKFAGGREGTLLGLLSLNFFFFWSCLDYLLCCPPPACSFPFPYFPISSSVFIELEQNGNWALQLYQLYCTD